MSDCDFCIGGEIDEPLRDYRCVVTDSGEPFTCYECNRLFPAGTPREMATGDPDYITGIPDFAVETCMDCHHIATALCCRDRLHGSLWDDAEAAFDEMPFSEGCLAKVETTSAKTFLQQRWRKWKGLA